MVTLSTFTMLLLVLYTYLLGIANAATNQPHGIVQISNVNPRNPRILVDEESDSTIPIAIARIGGCKYAAEIGFRCFERTAKDGLDFKCHYERLKWKDGECDQKLVYVTIYNDHEYEADEEFLFELYSLPNNIALGFDRILIVIQQNDANHGEIGIYPSVASEVEGMSLHLTIKRMFGKINKARVCYQAIPGTAKINFDVVGVQGCVEWKHNEDEPHSITIDTMQDELWEGNETFYIKLLNVEGATLSPEHFQSNITILQNNLNVALVSSTTPPCSESKKEIQIHPNKGQSFFVQFEVALPQESTVNDAYIIAEHITEGHTAVLKSKIVLKVDGIAMDETTVSCDNIPTSYDVLSHANAVKPKLDCNSIINHTVIMDNSVEFTCNLTVECINLDPLKNQPKYVTANTTYSRKQRLFCEDIVQGTDHISCQCDFPTIYDSDEWFLADLAFGSKYVTHSVGFEVRQMTQSTQWNNHSLATFMFTINEYTADSTTDWIFYLVTDAFPCQPTNWSEWSTCDAVPVGIGHSYRTKLAVTGLPGQEVSCNELNQHRQCVVNQGKTVSFSRVKIRVQEGDEGAIMTVRLNHELTANVTLNKSTLSSDELHLLKGFDVIIYFVIPEFFRKEIVIDPMRIGWQKEKWDIVHEVRITALDDSNIDALEQTITVSPKIYSVDREYNALVVNTLEIIVEDNDKCRYCGVGNVQPFNPTPPPPFWDFKSIFILVLFSITVLFVLWRMYRWFKRKYGMSGTGAYDKLQQDGLMDESSQSTDSSHSTERTVSKTVSAKRSSVSSTN